MASPINNLGSSLATTSTTGRPAGKAAEKEKPVAAAGDTVSSDIGALRQTAMASSADFDREKVETIKQAIAEGKYVIDPRRIAESFYSLERSLYGISSDAETGK
jgi:negative regulator of flagellin synthesis FlgM